MRGVTTASGRRPFSSGPGAWAALLAVAWWLGSNFLLRVGAFSTAHHQVAQQHPPPIRGLIAATTATAATTTTTTKTTRRRSRSSLCSSSPIIFPSSFQRNLPLRATSSSLDGSSPDSSAHSSTDRRLISLYRAGQWITGSVGLTLLFLPDRTLTTLLSAKLGGAAGFGLAAGVCHILAHATELKRLNSDTYKRLNVGLLGFFLVGLLAIPGEAAFAHRASSALALTVLLTLLRACGAAVAFAGWKRGVLGKSQNVETAPSPLKTLRLLATDLLRGTRETLMGILQVRNTKKALTYRNSLLLIAACMFSSFMEGLFDIQFKERFLRTWFEISLHWSAVGRLFLVTTILYTLKDAAERDRLQGTTFIQLHVLVGAWSGLVALGQSVYPLGFAPQRGIIMYALSALYFTKAIKGQKEKLLEQERKGNDLGGGPS